MKTSPFLINLLLYGPYVILLILFLIFYYRAISFHGITKMKKFTVVMLGAFVVAFALRFFKFDFFDWVPIQFLKIAGDGPVTQVLILLMMIYFVIAITKIRTEKNARFLSVTWLLIGLLCFAFNCWLIFLYARWKPSLVKADGSMVYPLDLRMVRTFYLTQMIYPFVWTLLCSISLWKIRKEKRRLVYG